MTEISQKKVLEEIGNVTMAKIRFKEMSILWAEKQWG